ncbi:39546_t:CDS:2 [Gigaspora margarita]|uniref:39546_t:CDS:1 n=1 Tax=Gigaspora margarita TaxID=4874 RepID=A0ABN7UDG2_GIGMA|nr:39546_t:CDS:2 [Gigaspora margarita]
MKIFVQPSLLSTSFIPRQNPLTITVWILDDDIYANPNKLCVQLWTNLITPNWTSVDLDEEQQHKIIGCGPDESYRVFKVVISTINIDEGWYEFTVRIKREEWNDWRWMSTNEGQNAKVFISKTENLNHRKDLNKSIFYEKIDDEKIIYSLRGNVDCWCISSSAKSNCGLPTPWWLIPVTGISKLDIQQKDVLYILIQQSSGHYVSLVPMASGDCICSFRSDENGGLTLFVVNDSECDSHARFVVGRGYDPYITTKACMDFINEINGINTVKTNSSIETEEHFDYDQIGFCTYNAFYGRIGQQHIIDALNSLEAIGVHIGYFLLDDGWQQVNGNRQLQKFEPIPEFYPDGFKGLINNIKVKDVPVYGEFYRFILVFKNIFNHQLFRHALWGYWNGVDPNSELSNSYRVERVKHLDEIIHLVVPQDIKKFYNDFYSYLKSQGVGIVKVDSQGSFDLIDYGQSRHRRWWREYHDALKINGEEYFGNRIIYCMAHSPNIIQQVLSGPDSFMTINRPLFRNSDDYFPDVHDSHAWHIYVNTMNSIWTSTLYSLLDWDMFQSHHKFGEYHAAARAISGGPVYITDIPNKHKLDVLEKCIVNTPTFKITSTSSLDSSYKTSSPTRLSTKLPQRILRSEGPALPSLSSLFRDSTKTNNLLKICNWNNKIGVLGLWNCRTHKLLDIFYLNEIYGLEINNKINNCNNHEHKDHIEEYALYFFKNKQTHVVNSAKEPVSIIVNAKEFELVTISPINYSIGKSYNKDFTVKIAPFGLIDKYNGSKAVISSEFISESVRQTNSFNDTRIISAENRQGRMFYKVQLVGYGECGFYLDLDNGKLSDTKAYLGSKLLKNVKYDLDKKLLSICLEKEDMENDGQRIASKFLNQNILWVELFLEITIE